MLLATGFNSAGGAKLKRVDFEVVAVTAGDRS